ncbi:hypothetical protein ACIRQQ_46420 [Streptomyces fuscichromogenes]|uniref:hypothetical protein n=1 Tax=Streptomyces fuscichromogenes TaxID=1324013 RepID=UPI00381E118E
MPQQMNGTQRQAVWKQALVTLGVVAAAGFGAWKAFAPDDGGSHNNSCHGPAVCGENNDGNTVVNGNNNGKK